MTTATEVFFRKPPTKSERKVIVIHTSDWHIDRTPPKFRNEKGRLWFKAMRRHIKQIADLQRKYDCPILHTGDLFDNWKQDPETINWLAANMPAVYGLPGQHDLLYHRLGDINKSAWWTMVETGRVKYVKPGQGEAIEGLVLYSFPWGAEITPCPDPPHTFCLRVALVHKYVWFGDYGFKNAPQEGRLKNLLKSLAGYDVVLTGDNHKTFGWNCDKAKENKPSVFNPGSLMRRHSDQMKHRPCVGLIYSDGTIGREYLNCSKDQFSDQSESEVLDLSGFVKGAQNMGEKGLDFREVVRRQMKRAELPKLTRTYVAKAMENQK